MAINKTINKSTKTHGAMRNCLEYVLQKNKIKDELIYMTGPTPEQLDWNSVYHAFIEEKQLWGKDSGRMYAHNIISFHADENITPQQALEFGKEFAENWFSGFQTLVCVHQDREHIRIHLVTNTVSYESGYKLHNTKNELQEMKDVTNRMCQERGFTIAEKGKHFDGTDFDEGEIIAWTKDKYHLLMDEAQHSYVADCGLAVLSAVDGCKSKEEFEARMLEHGWRVNWTDTRKYITFQDDSGNKVRSSNLSKTFHMDVTKEKLQNEFERQAERVNTASDRETIRAGNDRETGKDDTATTGAVERVQEQDRAVDRRTWEDAEQKQHHRIRH